MRHRTRHVSPGRRNALYRRRRKKRRILRTFLLLTLLLLGGAGFSVFTKVSRIRHTALDKEKLEISLDTGDHTNIALFGLDSREGELNSNVRSDCMMIASINDKTSEIKIVSVYRDTLLLQQDGSYGKANSAYFYGGPQEAVALLNRNLDLDIEKYVSVNFNALVDVIDILGGVEIDVQEEEIQYINGYSAEVTEVTGVGSPAVNSAGLQTLNGVQATSYSRIRYTAGDDFKRTERQRNVLQKIFEKMQKAGPLTWNRILDEVLPEISTNLTGRDLLGLAVHGPFYQIGEMTGFPFDIAASDSVQGLSGSYVIPAGLADNVSRLHAYLFGTDGYTPSVKVRSVSDDIVRLSGVPAR